MGNENRVRLILFIIVAVIHGVLIYFFAFTMPSSPARSEEPVRVMKLTDIIEDIPPPSPLPPPPPPPLPPPPAAKTVPDNAVEAIAEQMIETDEVPPDQAVVPAGTIQTLQSSPDAGSAAENYLPMHQVSVAPKFDDIMIGQKTIYPPIARRTGVEGTVYLELFIDRTGLVQQIKILKEDPPNRGFGEAAVKAFEGARCTPAQANGENVSVRYRYPVSFRIR
jgi:protein TonB